MAKQFKPKSSLLLRKDEQLKAFLHPVRRQILDYLTREQRTVSSIASELGVHPANITHHFRLLQKAGLIKLVEERDIGRVVEKYYRAVALHFDIRTESGEVKEREHTVLSLLRDDLNYAIHQYPALAQQQVTALLTRATITEKQYARFQKKLLKLIHEFQVMDGDEGTRYHLNLGLYPSDKDYGPIGKMEIK